MHTSAPFRELHIYFRYIWDHISIRLHSRALSSAYAIHWDPHRYSWSAQLPHQSTDSFSVLAASLRYVLSVLSGPSSLHTLSLSYLNVEPAHQKLILSIRTLRVLKLNWTSFTPTSMEMPRSPITALWLDHSPQALTKHFLVLLASSLETLRLGWGSEERYEALTGIPFPRLKFFEEPRWIGPTVHNHLIACSSITTLIIRFPSHPPVPPTILPNLTHLTSPYLVAKELIPGRPVRTYHMLYVPSLAYVTAPLEEIALLAQRVEELQLLVDPPLAKVVKLLAVHLPNLVRVRIIMMDELEHPPPREGLCSPQAGAESKHVHSSLREADIGFYKARGQSFPCEDCLEVLRMLTETCLVLEIVRFGELFPVDGGGIDERNVSLDWLMDMRRSAEGEWKERKWSMS